MQYSICWFQPWNNYLGLVLFVLARNGTRFWLLFRLTATQVLFSSRRRTLSLPANQFFQAVRDFFDSAICASGIALFRQTQTGAIDTADRAIGRHGVGEYKHRHQQHRSHCRKLWRNDWIEPGSQPGGVGLKFLKDFITLNEGKIHLASRLGFYEYCNGKETFEKLAADFMGTVVNLEINTGDTQSYRLSSEISPEDIF